MSELSCTVGHPRAFPGGSVVKKLPASAADVVEVGLIPGSRRLPGGGNSNQLHILVWEISWTESLAGYNTLSHIKSDTVE